MTFHNNVFFKNYVEAKGSNFAEAYASKTPKAGVSIRQKPEPGLEFARFAIALAAAGGNIVHAHEIAKHRYPNERRVITSLKAAMGAGTTTNPTWSAPLVDSYQRFAGDFVEFLRPQTIIGQFGAGSIPSLRRIPFNVSIPAQTSGGEGYWVGEGKPKPLTKFDFSEITLGFAKVANIAVLTNELIRFSNPDAELIVRDQLAAALIARLDTDFVNPAKAAVANVSPASIINGVTPIASSGADIEAVDTDIKALVATYLAANVSITGAVFIMRATTAFSLSLMKNVLGQKAFPEISLTGGSFYGLPAIVSDYVPEGTVILANTREIYLADDGQVMVDASGEASLEMSDAPTNDATTGQGASLVSMFQTNSVAIRAERYINWAKRRTNAVAVLTGAAWGDGALGS
ncbi:phage capsid protein [Devosia insulae DS-56]|uniref:Phage capsid protein n=1 Tax=Devosia insulae DS-56 TaxID=1116389 RepID=A0A1E5XQL2_9HYPH|nr:phage major capsid protein [Devosia insulae]OEO30902.1 phage capsid protein [Devosia insulae DS-56]